MGKLSKDVEETLSFIDAIITLLEMEESSFYFPTQLDVSISPIKLLLEILNRLGISNDEIVDFLAEFLIYAAPTLEYTLKALLLSKLKSNIDCNLDPRIPEFYREAKNERQMFIHPSYTNGFRINILSIDYKGILNLSPISSEGRFNYFGTSRYYYIDGVEEKFYTREEVLEYARKNNMNNFPIKTYAEVENVEELIRAKDFNAFLWYVFNRCKITRNVVSIDKINCIQWTENLKNCSVGDVYRNGNNYAMVIKSTDVQRQNGKVIESATSNDGYQNVKQEVNNEINNLEKTYTLAPFGNVLNGLNWYVNRQYYNPFFKGECDHNKDFAIFNVAPILGSSGIYSELSIRIKPKPNFYIPKIDVNFDVSRNESTKKIDYSYSNDSDSLKTMKKILFDVYGNCDSNGKFSVEIGDEVLDNDDYKINKIRRFKTDDEKIFLNIDTKNGTYNLTCNDSSKDITSILYECYPGLTVYEFNYDMVMGIKFFDAKVLAAQLIEAISNISIGTNFDWWNSHNSYERVRIASIAKKIINSESSFSDCFFSFSNEEYEAMLNESEAKRAALYPFNVNDETAVQINGEEIYKILNEYKDKPQYEQENLEVLKRTFSVAKEAISPNINGIDKKNVEKDFILNCLEAITVILIESILSPKVIMIMELNNQMLGTDNKEEWTSDYVIKAFENVITAFVDEMKDMILKYLFKIVEKKIMELLAGVAKLLLREQIEYYTRTINALLKACRFSRRKDKNIDTMLDYVDYADIDNVNKEEC